MSNVVAEAGLNQIPVGYKQTEVGVIPEDWECSCFDNVCSIIGDGIHSTPKYNDSGEYFFVNGNNLIDGKITTFDETKKTDLAEFCKHKKNLNQRTILLSINGTIGNIAFYKDEQIILGKSAAYLNIKSTINKYYIYYCLSSKKTLQAFYDGLTGSTIKNLSLGTIRKTNIPLPPQKEQTAIANALSDVDALITELEKLIAKKQAIKTATMQQLLTGRTRLPQFALREDGSQKGTKQSELGEIPEDWEVVYFDQLKDQKDNWAITGGPFGSNLKASDYTENGIRVIQLQNIGDGVFKNDDFVYTSKIKANELISCNIYPDEIILSKMGDPVARACLIPRIHDRYVMCSDGIRLKVNNLKYTEKFVFYFLNYPLFRKQALDASTGSTRKRIGLSELRELLLFAPSKKEQTAIATILSDMDEEIQALEQRLNKTGQIKQGMMQELLTGRTRLV